MIVCPNCGKELTAKTNTEQCPNSWRLDGLHPIFVVDFDCQDLLPDPTFYFLQESRMKELSDAEVVRRK